MTDPTHENRPPGTRATARKLVTPTEDESRVAVESSRALAAHLGGPGASLTLAVKNGKGMEDLVLPAPAVRLLLNVLTELGQGNAVALDTVHPELTTQQAADLLNVSRPYLVKLLDEGVIPSWKIGTHRRVLREDVLKYKADIDAKRLQALEELAAQAQELNMGY
ncbi:MAG: helix-turn-helix domain-containing protein [Gemmataceae bacterium]|nr:helix-turn-helix domain-containing protein [Gemmataceae bacterium]